MVNVDVSCPQCKHEFEIDDLKCSSLRDAVENAVDDAVSDARAEAMWGVPEREVLGSCGCIMLGELSCAIRAGDKAEAELLLDRIAELIGGDAEHQVSLGRFRTNPLLAKAA